MVAKNISILIVEDDSCICDALQEILSSEGHTIHLAYHGKEALTFLQQNSSNLPDLILLDAMMPLMGGIEFRKIQMLDPVINSIPVIMMSADINIIGKLESLNLHHFIKKPLDLNSLINLIKQI